MSLDIMFPLTLSHSSFSDALRCEVYFVRSQIQKLSAPRSSDLIAGGHFAAACEITRKAVYNDKKDIDEAIDLGYNYILEAEDTGDSLKSNDRLAFLFKKYFQRFPIDETWTPIPLADGTFAIEYKFEFDTGIQHPDFPDRNIHWTGVLDMLAEKRVAGGRKVKAVIDEKTCKSVKRVEGSKVIDVAKEELSYLSDGQLINYAFAARQLGIDVETAFIRRIPILTNYEPAFELEIPITDFMVENYTKSVYNKIGELVERYKFYKEKGDLFSAFTANYNTACNAFARSCRFKQGCIRKEGEEILEQTYQQIVRDRFTGEEISLREYKERLSNGIK